MKVVRKYVGLALIGTLILPAMFAWSVGALCFAAIALLSEQINSDAAPVGEA